MALLLCDLDDTLADRQAIFDTWTESFLAEIGQDSSEASSWLIELDARGYTPRDEFFIQVLERFMLEMPVEEMAERYHRDYVQSFYCSTETVSALRRARGAGFKIAIVTNGPTRAQAAKIAAAGIGDLVDTCCISEAEGFWKPAPELFRIAAGRCGEPLEGAWMIGDNPVADIGGAAALGISTVWIPLGRTWPTEVAHQPTLQADSVSEAVEAILEVIQPTSLGG